MAEDNEKMQPSHDESKKPLHADFLRLANDANDSGDVLLSMYLYLAAFQNSAKSAIEPNEDAIVGLKKAWSLACNSKERALAEYIFELMEPFLTNDEVSACAERLQDMALDKLSEIGLSRDELKMMAQSITEDIVSAEGEIGLDGLLDSFFSMISPSDNLESGEITELAESDAKRHASIDPIDGALRDAFVFSPTEFNYSNLAGFDKIIKVMREIGIGADSDPSYAKLVDMLNKRHGLTISPAPDSILFRSDIREDANRFTLATVGEIGLPAVHMRMEEGIQGSPILCISTYSMDLTSPISLKEAFKNGGVLVLENLDLWESPVSEPSEDDNPFLFMQMTRGAREAISLIQSAVENPEVFVFATASKQETIDEFFLDLLEPLSFVDIDLPDEQDRLEIWMDICKNHPSIRQINKKDLVKYSANMARFDIYMAAREAIEEAYKIGISAKKYVPITRDNLFDKLACYQPLESDEYTKLEDEVVRDFQGDLEHIDDILNEK